MLKLADRQVPEHPEKSDELIGRTALKLLRRGPGFYPYAIGVWGAHSPVGLKEREAYARLLESISDGWITQRMTAPQVEDIHLHRPVRIVITRGAEFRCVSDDIPLMVARGSSSLEAFQQFMRVLRERTATLLRSLTHELELPQVREKQRLLGLVDVVASRLMAEVPESTWVFGRLESDPGTQMLSFRSMGSRLGTFPLGEALRAQGLAPDDRARFARVKAGPGGEPIGPVVELEPPTPLTLEQAWSEWRRRVSGDA